MRTRSIRVPAPARHKCPKPHPSSRRRIEQSAETETAARVQEIASVQRNVKRAWNGVNAGQWDTRNVTGSGNQISNKGKGPHKCKT